MYHFLSNLHDVVRRSRLTRQGATHRPEDVPQGIHKSYARMQQFPLQQPAPTHLSLEDALSKRISQRSPHTGEALSFAECSTLLGHALKKRDQSLRRNYPSGGGLFPIETYLVSLGITDVGAGVFHYNPSTHALERLWDLPHDFNPKRIVPRPTDLMYSTLIVFTSVWHRSAAKYGDLSYSHALLEAGHMSENVLLLATALNLNACPMAGFNDGEVAKLLDLDSSVEQPVHTITLSKSSTRHV